MQGDYQEKFPMARFAGLKWLQVELPVACDTCIWTAQSSGEHGGKNPSPVSAPAGRVELN